MAKSTGSWLKPAMRPGPSHLALPVPVTPAQPTVPCRRAKGGHAAHGLSQQEAHVREGCLGRCGEAALVAAAVAAGSRLQRRQHRRRQVACRAGIAPPTETEALDILFSPEEEEEPPDEFEDPPFVLSTHGDIIIVRSGCDLKTVTKLGTVVEFDMGATGVLVAWKEAIGMVFLLSGEVNLGETLKGTSVLMNTEASSAMRGRILNYKGEPMDGRPAPPVPADLMVTFATYKGMAERTNQYRPFFSGVSGIDFSVPIGRGQTMLFQGTDPVKDKKLLWPDLLNVKPLPGFKDGPDLCVCVCKDMEEAEELRATLEERGCWDRCVLFVPTSPDLSAAVLAMNGAMAFAEHAGEKNGEATVVMDLEPMHRAWNILAGAAGEERRAKGITIDPKDEVWTELEGTVLRESIAERRKFWFALVSRANNSLESGSVTLLPWVWEKPGGLDYRKLLAFQKKLEEVEQIPRISEETKDKLRQKITAEAKAAGLHVPEKEEEEGEEGEEETLDEPSAEIPGVPNWEIEELKSISDGHIVLRSPTTDTWGWNVDPYKSLPRLGTDALHAALVSVDAHRLRLKMLQGRDRATMLRDTLGSPMLDTRDGLELKFVELLLDQPAAAPLSVEEEVAQIIIVVNPRCKPLRAEGGCNSETLKRLVEQLLASEAGRRAKENISQDGVVGQEAFELLTAEVERWE